MKRLILILGLFAGILHAQDPAVTLHSTTRLVEINVIATDKNGPADHLTQDDFTIFDEGKKQKIAIFTVNDRRTQARPAAPAQSEEPNHFTNRPGGVLASANAVLIVWDTLNTGIADQMWARTAVLKSLQAIRPGDRVGLYILGFRMQVLQDFTDDSSKLVAALDKYATMPELFAGLGPVLADFRVTGRTDDTLALDKARQTVTTESLRDILHHLIHIPGRKSLIWVSSQLPPNILIGANIAIYPVDARGLVGFNAIRAENRTAPSAPPTNPAGIQFMRDVAEKSGGKAFVNTNDLRGAIDQAISDTDLTYTLGFYPDSIGLPLHKMKVTVARHGVDLRYRNIYRSVAPDGTPAQSPENQIATAIASPLDATKIGIRAKVERDSNNLLLTVTLDAADIELEQSDTRHRGVLDYSIVAKTEGISELRGASGQIKLDFAQPEYDSFLRDGLAFNKAITVPPGKTVVKVVIFDRTSGQVGSLTMQPPGK